MGKVVERKVSRDGSLESFVIPENNKILTANSIRYTTTIKLHARKQLKAMESLRKDNLIKIHM